MGLYLLVLTCVRNIKTSTSTFSNTNNAEITPPPRSLLPATNKPVLNTYVIYYNSKQIKKMAIGLLLESANFVVSGFIFSNPLYNTDRNNKLRDI